MVTFEQIRGFAACRNRIASKRGCFCRGRVPNHVVFSWDVVEAAKRTSAVSDGFSVGEDETTDLSCVTICRLSRGSPSRGLKTPVKLGHVTGAALHPATSTSSLSHGLTRGHGKPQLNWSVIHGLLQVLEAGQPCLFLSPSKRGELS